MKCKRVYRQSVKIEAPDSRMKSPTNPRYNQDLIDTLENLESTKTRQ